MNGSKPTSPAYCPVRFGGRLRNGIAAEYLERGALVVVVDEDTMATEEMEEASVMVLYFFKY